MHQSIHSRRHHRKIIMLNRTISSRTVDRKADRTVDRIVIQAVEPAIEQAIEQAIEKTMRNVKCRTIRVLLRT